MRTNLQTLVLPTDESAILEHVDSWEFKIARRQARSGKTFDEDTKFGALYNAMPKGDLDAVELDLSKY